MAKYTANIVAKVEMGQLDKLKSQIEALEKKEINLNLNASGLNLNNLFSQLQKQATTSGASVGKQAGQAISNGIKASTKSFSFKDFSGEFSDLNAQLTKAFENIKIDPNLAAGVEESLNGAISRIDKLKATVSTNGNLEFNISGVNALGDAASAVVSVINTIDEAGNKIPEFSAKFSTLNSDVSGNASAIKAQAEAYKELNSIIKQVGDLKSKIETLDPDLDSAKIQQYSNEIANLDKRFQQLLSDNNISQSNWMSDSNLSKSFTDASVKISETKAKMQDLQSAAAKSVQLKLESGTIDAQFSKIESDLASLKAKGSSSVDSLSQSFERLKSQKNALDGLSGEELVSGYKNLEVEITKFNSALTVAKNNAKQFASATDISKTSSSFETWLSKNSKALDKYGDKIDEVRQQLAKFKEVGATTSELNNVKTAIDNIKTTAASQGNLGVTWVDKLGDQFKKLSTYVSAASVIYTGIRALKSMYSAVSDIDTQMTELKKVTDETDATYSQFLDGAKSKAVELGVTVSDLVSATADFARLGYSMQEATNLAQVATIYANVGDDVGSIEEATSSIISTMKAFNMTSEQSILIVDKFNEV